MVGDSLTVDIAGDAGAGLRTVWIPEHRLARQHATYGPDFFLAPEPDAIASSVAEAADMLLASG